LVGSPLTMAAKREYDSIRHELPRVLARRDQQHRAGAEFRAAAPRLGRRESARAGRIVELSFPASFGQSAVPFAAAVRNKLHPLQLPPPQLPLPPPPVPAAS